MQIESANNALILRLDALCLRRGGRALLAGGQAEIAGGMAVALRGDNGAGKTSLLRCLAGLMPPQAGCISLCRNGVALPSPALSCHFLGAADGLKSRLSVAENLTAMARLYGGAVEKILADMARFGLAAHLAQPVHTLSGGQRRRLALARLACGARPVWLLDEPYAALDADGRAMLNGMVAAHLETGGLVIAATHEPLGFATHGWHLAGRKLTQAGRL